jgi:hypothetical protein
MLGIIAAIRFFSSLKISAADSGSSRAEAWSSVCAHAFRKYLPQVAAAATTQAAGDTDPPS